MNKMLGIWRRLTSLRYRGKLGRELEEEMQHHIEMKARELVDKGMIGLTKFPTNIHREGQDLKRGQEPLPPMSY